jgi:hypothetical protein
VDRIRRTPFNSAYSDARFNSFLNRLQNRVGPVPFRVAETPLFVTPELRDELVRSAGEIVAQLSDPDRLSRLRRAVPARYDVPRMDSLPNTVQVDFALVEDGKGGLTGKLIELQGFPSLYALMPVMAEVWNEELRGWPGMPAEEYSCFVGNDRSKALEVIGRTLLAGNDPQNVVLVDYAPEQQKTSPDFVATQRLFGVDAVCVTQLVKKGRQLFREKGGRLIRVKRIYNRMVFDELEVKNVKVPFDWNDDLDVTWASHPNWYWVWSKYSLPHLDHPAVPKTRYLSEFKTWPEELSRYVLKPLFSFAGSGVVVDVTPADLAKVPKEQYGQWVLQEKVEYAPVIPMPDGNGVKAEVRIMLMRPPDAAQLTPVLPLVRLSRGKMLGVDYNKGLTWVGGSVGIWAE